MKYLIITTLIGLISCNHQTDNDNINLTSDYQTTDELVKGDSTLFDCYDGNQLEMNVCSLNEYLYYDSLLNKKFDFLIKKIDSNIEKVKEYQYEFEQSINYKKNIISSQELWIHLRDINAEICGLNFEGGSMQPLVENTQSIIDTKNRIKFIEELISIENN